LKPPSDIYPNTQAPPRIVESQEGLKPHARACSGGQGAAMIPVESQEGLKRKLQRLAVQLVQHGRISRRVETRIH